MNDFKLWGLVIFWFAVFIIAGIIFTTMLEGAFKGLSYALSLIWPYALILFIIYLIYDHFTYKKE